VIRRRRFLFGLGTLVSKAGIAAELSNRGYDDPEDIYQALRSESGTPLHIAGGEINVVFANDAPGLDKARALRWVKKCVEAIATYFGRYPTRSYGLLIVAEAGDHVGHAVTYGYRGSVTLIRVGIEAGDRAFADDWVLVHEMVHTALPDLPRRALWLQEGSATWIEPVARAQIGELPVAEVWRQAINGMPKGVTSFGGGGMDGTRDWGRLYWGGAVFWLEAEIAIYQQSQGRFLLRDALRAINRESGGNSVEWSPEKMMQVGDQATGTVALANLYERFSARGFDGSLPELFERLGVGLSQSGNVYFNQAAELAKLAQLITDPLRRR
jgi:hypothetical protein